MKKSVKVCLAILLAASLSFTASGIGAESFVEGASKNVRISELIKNKIESLGTDISVQNIRYISDFDDNEYAVIECVPTGYFVLHPETGVITEYSISAISPYANCSVSDGDLYYAGPTYYYKYDTGEYEHTVLAEKMSATEIDFAKKVCTEFVTELQNEEGNVVVAYLNGEVDAVARNIASPVVAKVDFWVTNYSWIKNRTSGFGYKDGGYCGYIAANLLLKYHNYCGNLSLPSMYATTNSTALTNELINYGSSASTTGVSIESVINRFCAANGLKQLAVWAAGVYGVDTEIYSHKRPSILFGNLPNGNGGKTNHAVLVYGCNTYENTNLTTYVVHYGWNGYSEVHICSTNSIFGTNTKYKI